MEDIKLKKLLSDNLKLKLGHIRTLLAEQCIHPNYLKPMQAKCLLSVLKTNTLIILPTVYGKSLIYDILPYLCCTTNQNNSVKKIAILSPLNIIIDSVLQRHPVTATSISSIINSVTIDDDNDSEEKPVNEQQSNDFVYIIGHPEQLLNDQAIVKLKKSTFVKDVSHIVIDEIHCIVT